MSEVWVPYESFELKSGWERVRTAIAASPSAPDYLHGLYDKHARDALTASAALQLILNVGNRLRILEAHRGVEPHQAYELYCMFAFGGVLGMEVMEQAGAGHLLDRVERSPFSLFGTDAELQAQGVAIMEKGVDGYTRLELADYERLTVWGCELAHGNVVKTLTFKQGFGYMVQAVYEAQDADFERFVLASAGEPERWPRAEAYYLGEE